MAKIQRGGKLPKLGSVVIPFLKDQGMPTLAGAAKIGTSLQACIALMPGASPQTVTLLSLGLEDMADALYKVNIQNNTSAARPATATAKTTAQFVITGPNASDSLDIIVVGCLKGQLQ